MQTTTAGINEFGQNVNLPWAGADNTNHFYTPEELFDPTKTEIGVPALPGFVERLQQAGTNNSTYDRYTFYRMLSQIGTDTAPESGRMNLNYDNLDTGSNGVLTVTGSASVTNFVPWQPLVFFTNAADRMLRAYTAHWFQSGPSNYLQTFYGINGYNYYHLDPTGTYTVTNDPNGLGLTNAPFFGMTNQIPAFGITGIPVCLGFSNQFVYTPSVQRVLQLAANIYDATTTNYYPSVFRPLFSTNITGNYANVFITGYTTVTNMLNPASDSQLDLPVDASALAATPNLPNNVVTNVYGVPWIIGAKKGFPNFNAFTMENIFQISRKLQITRPNTNETFLTNPQDYITSQQLTLGITNMLGVECWNSYRADYTNAQPMEIFASDANTVVLTNDEGVNYQVYIYTPGAITNTDWPGYGYATLPQQSSFLVPLAQSVTILPTAVYTFNPANPFALPSPAGFATNTLSPHWGLLITNRLRVIMTERNPTDGLYHIIDYAQFIGPDSSHDLTADIQNLYDKDTNGAPVSANSGNNNGYDDQWDSIFDNQGTPFGIDYQLNVSLGTEGIIYSPPTGNYWSSQDPTTITNMIDGFPAFFGYDPLQVIVRVKVGHLHWARHLWRNRLPSRPRRWLFTRRSGKRMTRWFIISPAI